MTEQQQTVSHETAWGEVQNLCCIIIPGKRVTALAEQLEVRLKVNRSETFNGPRERSADRDFSTLQGHRSNYAMEIISKL